MKSQKIPNMADNNLKITVILDNPDLGEEDLQEAVQMLQTEISEVQGVAEAELIPITEAPPNSKGIGGFLLGQLQALVTAKHLKTLASFLSKNLQGNKVKIQVEGNGKKLKLELNRPEDIDVIMPKVEEFING